MYNVKKHKKVMNGMWTEEQAYADFLKSFDSPDDPDGIVNCSHILVHTYTHAHTHTCTCTHMHVYTHTHTHKHTTHTHLHMHTHTHACTCTPPYFPPF